MASLTIRNLDDALMQRLRMQAAKNVRSMEEEARQILTAAVASQVMGSSGTDLYRAIRAHIEPLGGVDPDLPPREPAREPPDFNGPKFDTPESKA